MFQEFLHKLEVTEKYCGRRTLFRLRTSVNLIYRSHKLHKPPQKEEQAARADLELLKSALSINSVDVKP